MGLFEFLMILISVVIGLALTELLTGVADLLRARSSVRFYWLHLLFQFGVFFALLQQWWESWDQVNVAEVDFGLVLLWLLPSVLLFLLAHLLYPRPTANSDLEAYYYEQAPVLWSLVLLGALVGMAISILEGERMFELSNLSGLPMIAFCLALIASDNRRLHALIAPLLLILVVLDTWLANPTISAQ